MHQLDASWRIQCERLLIEKDPDDVGQRGPQTFIIDFHCQGNEALESTFLFSNRTSKKSRVKRAELRFSSGNRKTCSSQTVADKAERGNEKHSPSKEEVSELCCCFWFPLDPSWLAKCCLLVIQKRVSYERFSTSFHCQSSFLVIPNWFCHQLWWRKKLLSTIFNFSTIKWASGAFPSCSKVDDTFHNVTFELKTTENTLFAVQNYFFLDNIKLF